MSAQTSTNGSTPNEAANAAAERMARRVAELNITDQQFADATPNLEVTAAIQVPGMRLREMIAAVMKGYADRPALGQRRQELVTDPATSRKVLQMQPTFDTISYRDLWDRVNAVANVFASGSVPLSQGQLVCTLGFASVDYVTVDLALVQLGAVSVPLQTSAPLAQLQPIVAETRPTILAVSLGHLSDAVELALSCDAIERLVVFDFNPGVDDHRDALAAAQSALSRADCAAGAEPLTSVIERGRALPPATLVPLAEEDPLALVLYTSGSTGAPKGAMHTERLVANRWRNPGPLPSITLNFMPMSHGMGRGMVYMTMSAGGTAYFGAKSDLSTLFEDLALVRPTDLHFVPRIWDLLYQEYQSTMDRRSGEGVDPEILSREVQDDICANTLGGRYLSALNGAAPLSAETAEFVQTCLGVTMINGFGATESGPVSMGGRVLRPPIIDYKLVDVPELGYFNTDQPHPRGELLIKSTDVFPGYYKRPDVTAEAFDDEGYYRTGDVMAELAPDQLEWIDRRNNVLKLSQGEFVAVSNLETVFSGSPLVHQIYLYGSSERSFLIAVVVPAAEAQRRAGGDGAALKSLVIESLQATARAAGLQSYEIPRDVLIETDPFTVENGLLSGVGKTMRPRLKDRYGERLEKWYHDIADAQSEELRALRRGSGSGTSTLETICRATGVLLGAASSDVDAKAHFTDLGGDSLSALSFSNLLSEIFGLEVPVGVIISPVNDLRAVAGYVDAQRTAGSARPTFASVHGTESNEVRANDLALEKFIDMGTLDSASALPRPSGELRNVLVTGTTGFLGRYLLLDWLQRLAPVGGKVVCLVRGSSPDAARSRLDAIFDCGDPGLLGHYQELAANGLEVLASDVGEPSLGLDQETWERLAETVDAIVHAGALVNHVLPYSQLFGPNTLGTAELVRLALSTKLKAFAHVSTIAVGSQIEPAAFDEDADIRVISPARRIDEGHANGYATSKWASEVLLREANERFGLPVVVFRCDMIMADAKYVGQLNLPDVFTRLVLSVVATGLAPNSFYETDAAGHRQRAHYDGLPVDFIAESISALGVQTDGFHTYHVMNPHDDGRGMDEFVDWLVEAGHRVQRLDCYDEWYGRFEMALRALPEKQRQASLLPVLHTYRNPDKPLHGAMAPVDRFRAAVRGAKIGTAADIPHIEKRNILKYVTNLQLLGLL